LWPIPGPKYKLGDLVKVGFSPPANIGSGYLSKLKLYYELLKRGAFEKSGCLNVLLKESVKLLRPYVKSLETYNCFVY